MKNSIIVFIGLLGLLMAGCTGRDSKPELLSEHEDSSKPTKFVVSIPAIVLNKVLTDSSSLNHTTQENLKELWNFDNQFSEALARGRSLGPRILTRKINPCCPCDMSGNDCCPCVRVLYFGSTISMNTTLTFDNSRLTPVDSTSTLRLYQIPSAKDNGTYSLRITGNNIDPPLELDVKIDNGRIDF